MQGNFFSENNMVQGMLMFLINKLKIAISIYLTSDLVELRCIGKGTAGSREVGGMRRE